LHYSISGCRLSLRGSPAFLAGDLRRFVSTGVLAAVLAFFGGRHGEVTESVARGGRSGHP
jgi:hypothetical protein